MKLEAGLTPLIKYVGGKRREVPNFISYIPPSFDRYIEPFAGGLAVYFYLEPERAILSDLSEPLMRFYTQVKTDFPRIHSELDSICKQWRENHRQWLDSGFKGVTPNLKLYKALRHWFSVGGGPYLDGTLYYVLSHTSVYAIFRRNSSGYYNSTLGARYNLLNWVTPEAHALMQGADLYTKDYKDIFAMAQPGDFMFLDPPYQVTLNNYAHQFGEIDGFNTKACVDLAAAFKTLPCKALMIVNKTNLMLDLYKDYIFSEYKLVYSIRRGALTNHGVHLIIRNY